MNTKSTHEWLSVAYTTFAAPPFSPSLNTLLIVLIFSFRAQNHSLKCGSILANADYYAYSVSILFSTIFIFLYCSIFSKCTGILEHSVIGQGCKLKFRMMKVPLHPLLPHLLTSSCHAEFQREHYTNGGLGKV